MIRPTSILSVMTLMVTTSVAHAAFTTPACLAKKRTAWGNLRKCQATEEAKQLLGKTPDLPKCQTKFDAKVTATTAKATAAGVPCRYADNGDGTVIDYDTGLQWEKKTPGKCSATPQLCLVDTDCPVGTCVAADPHYVNDAYSWNDALIFVNGTSDGSPVAGPFVGFAGHSDWRLPSLDELRGVVDLNAAGCDTGSPCIDPIFGPAPGTNGGFPPFQYWSATTQVSNPPIARLVNFYDGSVGTFPKGMDARVRAVRSAL